MNEWITTQRNPTSRTPKRCSVVTAFIFHFGHRWTDTRFFVRRPINILIGEEIWPQERHEAQEREKPPPWDLGRMHRRDAPFYPSSFPGELRSSWTFALLSPAPSSTSIYLSGLYGAGFFSHHLHFTLPKLVLVPLFKPYDLRGIHWACFFFLSFTFHTPKTCSWSSF